MKMKLVLKLKE
jgi:hypothetical protein